MKRRWISGKASSPSSSVPGSSPDSTNGMPACSHRTACRFHHRFHTMSGFCEVSLDPSPTDGKLWVTKPIPESLPSTAQSGSARKMASSGWRHPDKRIKFIVLTHPEKGNIQHSSELLKWYAVPTMQERTAGRLARDLVRVNGFDPLCKPSVREPPRERPPSLR